MKKYGLILFLAVCSIFASNNYVYSQASAQNQAVQEPIIIKPTMPIEYIVFASNALSTIEIQGSEVDVYLNCKNVLDTEIKKLAAEKKRPEDIATFSIQLETAQNMITLLNRAKLTGADAPRFKGFMNAMLAAGKNYKPENKK